MPCQYLQDFCWTESWLNTQLASNRRFYVIAFTSDAFDGQPIQPVQATWNSFYEIIQMKSPACFARIDRHRDAIEAMMWHLPAHTELDFDQVIGNSIPEEQKRKINSFEASAVPEGEVTPIMCR